MSISCGDRICNGAESCSSCSTDCGICQNCQLKSATFVDSLGKKVTSAKDGHFVYLNVSGTNCNNQAIKYEVWEEEGFSGGEGNDIVEVIDGRYSSQGWTVRWTYPGDDDFGNEQREYYFVANFYGDRAGLNG